MRQKILLLSLIAFLGCSANAQAPGWYSKIMSVKLLSDTKEGIIKLFGQPTNNGQVGHVLEYYDEDMHTTFILTRPTCEPAPGDPFKVAWNVPEMSVMQISVAFPKLLFQPPNPSAVGVKFADLGAEVRDFKTVPLAKSDPGSIEYYSAEKGITYSVNSKGSLEGIWIFPNPTHRSLRCN